MLTAAGLSFQSPQIAAAGGTVEVFATANSECTQCQGFLYIGQATVDGTGQFLFDVDGAGYGTDCNNDIYVITVTDGTDNTSEFSACSICPPCKNAVAVGGDDDSTCFESLVDLSLRTNVTDTVGSGNTATVLWEDFDDSDGSVIAGTFSSTSVLNPTYTPPANFAGIARLRLIITPSDVACVADTDTVLITVVPLPEVSAGDDAEVCMDQAFDLSTRTNVADSSNVALVNGVTWDDGGAGGAFSAVNVNSINPTYTPALNYSGTVTLSITGASRGICTDSVDAMQLVVTPEPEVTAGDDAEVCEGLGFDLSTRVNVADSLNVAAVNGVTWSDGAAGGTFTTVNANSINPTYTPAANFTGDVTLSITGTKLGSCTDSTDTMILTVTPKPGITAGDDAEVCENVAFDLSTRTNVADSSNVASVNGVTWNDGAAGGTFTTADANSINPTYTPAANFSGDVILSITGTRLGSCTDSTDTMTLTVTAEPTATISPATANSCGTTAYSGLTGTAANGTISWSDSTALGVAAGGSFAPATGTNDPTYTPAVANGSVFTLYKTVAGGGSCPDVVVSMDLTVNPGPTVNAGSDSITCQGTLIDLSTRSPLIASVSGATGQNWTASVPGGTWSDASVVNPTYTPPASMTTGTITLTLEGTGNAPCTSVTDDMVLTIQTNPSASTVSATKEVCEDGTVTLSAGDVTALNYDLTSIVWTGGTGTITNGNTLTPSYEPLAAEGGTTVTLTMAVDAISPCTTPANTTLDIDITDAPTVTAGADVDTCINETYDLNNRALVDLADTTSASSVSWLSSVPGGTWSSTTAINPTYTPPVGHTADITLTIEAVGKGSCTNRPTDNLVFRINTLPTPTITGGSATPCADDLSEVYSTTTTYPNGYAWSNTFGATENGSATSATYDLAIPSSGSGNVAVTVTDANNCVGSTTFAVLVQEQPQLTHTLTAICETAGTVPGSLNNITVGGVPVSESNFTFTWFEGPNGDGTDNDITIPNAGSANANLAVADGDDVYLRAVLTGSGCTAGYSTITQAVVNQTPSLTVTPMVPYCVNDNFTITFNDQTTGVGYSPNYAWTLNGNSIPTSGLTRSDALGVSGSYTYRVVATNGTGAAQCSDDESVSIDIKNPAVLAAASSTWIDKGESVTISASHLGSLESYSYSWETSPVGASGDGSTVSSFTSTPLQSTVYNVTSGLLNVADPNSGNCKALSAIRVTVVTPPIPDQVFTPGNGDGKNDFWRISFLNASDYPDNVVKVYNRWGNIVYEGKGYDYDGDDSTPEVTGEKWDGTRNGNLVPVATYYYVIELNDPDETLLSGAITIIR